MASDRKPGDFVIRRDPDDLSTERDDDHAEEYEPTRIGFGDGTSSSQCS